MLSLLWLIPAIPFLSAAVLSLFGSRFARSAVAVLGVGSIGLSALLTALLGAEFLASPPPGDAYSQQLWTWMDSGGFQPAVAFYLDPIALLMLSVVTGVGFLIHLFSAEYMAHDGGYPRFFAYMNLFVASMITLVLADNLLLLYLGWEGVGLCSFLLIGFWYQEPANVRAARKAFLMTRFGDTSFAVGLFLLFTHLGTLNIQDLLQRAETQWVPGAGLAVAAAALLLGGAVGKSAQLPLQTWLPNAMAGPTPTSALIHAATMVTAGVYLIARTHTLFTLAPSVQFAVAVIGAATMLLAACSALVQHDMKRVLAYSTISQIGYMFIALGVGAWSAAMFHLMTHACFKALLFLSAGVVIHAISEQNLLRMGGLRTRLPLAFWSFVIGGSALAGLPLVTAGFFSKDLILFHAGASPEGSVWLWVAGLTGAVLTSLYTFRLIFLAFLGPVSIDAHDHSGFAVRTTLIVLCVLSVTAGYLNASFAGGGPALTNFLQRALPPLQESHAAGITEGLTAFVASGAFLLGLGLAYWLYGRAPDRAGALNPLQRFWYSGWAIDALYDRVFVRPFGWITAHSGSDLADSPIRGLTRTANMLYITIRVAQNGSIRWYATSVAAGTVLTVALALLLR